MANGGTPIAPSGNGGSGPDRENGGGTPIGPDSTFGTGGAPISGLGGVLSGGLPLGGPVTQVFPGGSAPQPDPLYAATLTSSGPISNFPLGAGGDPIGSEAAGGGLPIGEG